MEEEKLKLENTYIKLPKIFYSIQNPSHVLNPKLQIFNYSLAEDLGLDSKFFTSHEGIEILSGNKILEHSTPISQAYAGHQFGYFTMLGDGRATLLGEFIDKKGERFDIQLKGSGKTKYSRGGDGKAALGPMLREYIISEGMNALKIPTTRSLAVTTTGETVMREKELQGAILTRVAKSHIRIGTFEYVSQWGSTKDLKALADYSIKRHFKEGLYSENPYLFLLNEVVKKQAELISKWQLVGFIHGVMNTDNMSISGETIDYGPCAFMDIYNPKTVFSSIDIYGRYAYENQPKIAAWNLARFAETLIPLLSNNEEEAINLAQKSILNFNELYEENWYSGMRKKLGLFNKEEEDKNLIELLLNIMEKYKADYTNTFSNLTLENTQKMAMFSSDEFKKWNELWEERLKRQNENKKESIKLMKKNNPRVIPRNERVEEALEYAEKGDYSLLKKLLNILSNPYDYSLNEKHYIEVSNDKGCKYKTYCGT